MSTLSYSGPRVEINQHGIFYKSSKEDKYVYLTTALTLLKAVHNNRFDKVINVVTNPQEALDEISLSHYLKQYNNDYERMINNEIDLYEKKIDHKIETIQNFSHLNQAEREVWIKNMDMMKDYQLKRASNKIYYMYLIDNIIEVIRAKKVKEIHTPFTKRSFHVLNSLKGRLISGKPSLDAKVIHTYDTIDNMILKLMVRI